MYQIYPKVKQIKYGQNTFLRPEKLSVFFEVERVNAFTKLKSFYKTKVSNKKNSNLLYLVDASLAKEEYKIEIKDEKIYIYSSSNEGAFYATVSLYFILKEETLVEASILDYPTLAVRGFTYDISRNKVTKLEELKRIVDILALLKYNHFELYVEGLSFEYEKYKRYQKDDAYITKEEFKELEKYCNNNAIDLVPNENGFGHMGDWLALDEFKDLAECPGGIYLWGRQREATTLDPNNPKSLELVKDLYSEMLPLSNSKYFNMNFDEPFELGKGKSKELVEKEGLGKVYIDYTLKVVEEIRKYNKTPLIWMDVLIKHGDLLHMLPKDMIFMDWGYDALSPFDKNLKLLKSLDTTYISAPGTSSWCSFFGRTDAALENIKNAIDASVKYDALGSVLTDWGDFGHLQFQPISYPEMVYFGLGCWNNSEGLLLDTKKVLNEEIFKDESKLIGEMLLSLGRYCNYENHHQSNGTEVFYTFMWSTFATRESDPIEYFKTKNKGYLISLNQFNILDNFFKEKLKELKMLKLKCKDAKLIVREIKENIKLVMAIYKLMMAYSDEVRVDKKLKYLDEILALDLVKEREELWMARNKRSDFALSKKRIEDFIEFVLITSRNLRGGTL